MILTVREDVEFRKFFTVYKDVIKWLWVCLLLVKSWNYYKWEKTSDEIK